MVTDMIRLGNKVDIRLIQQIEQVEKTGVSPHVYGSKVFDISDEGDIELIMPIESGKVILLPLGVRYEFVFYTSLGLYRSVGQVKERYKKENVYVLLIELKSQLTKFQRREYYRFPCLVDMQYFHISQEDAQKKSSEDIFQGLRDNHFYDKQKSGSIVDLSGGGVRFTSDEGLNSEQYILLILRLCNDNMDKQYFLAGHVLSSSKIEGEIKKFENRVQFIFRDPRVREEIIRYIFEEERRTRNRGKG